jgi:uncharacterized membrane protein YfcA
LFIGAALGLLGGLAAVMLITALAMRRERAQTGPTARRPLVLSRVLAIGAAVGLVSGLVGAGGGFLIVPALALFGGLAMHEAIGTSLFIITLQSFAGFAGYVGLVSLDWRIVGTMTGAAVMGMLAGTALGKRVSAQGLKRGFAGLVFATGLFVLAHQLPLEWTALLVASVMLSAAGLRARRKPPHATPKRESECITSARFQP